MSTFTYPHMRKGVLALVALAFLFSNTYIFSRILSRYFLDGQQIYLRVLVAIVVTAILFYNKIRYKNYLNLTRREVAVSVAKSIAMYVGLYLFVLSVPMAKVGNLSFIQAAPLTPLIGFLVFKEKLSVPKFLLLLLSYVGVLLLVMKSSLTLSWGLGELLSLISAIFFAAGYSMTKLESKKINSYEAALLSLVVGFFFIIGIAAFLGEPFPSARSFTTISLLTLVWAGAANSLMLVFINIGFANAPNYIAGMILSLESIFVLIAGYVLYSEIPTLKETAGMACVLVSIIGINMLLKKNRHD